MYVSNNFSILGLKASATDEDIRRYYKRQAVLVHPDKVRDINASRAGKNFSGHFDFFFPQEKGFDISYNLSPLMTNKHWEMQMTLIG